MYAAEEIEKMMVTELWDADSVQFQPRRWGGRTLTTNNNPGGGGRASTTNNTNTGGGVAAVNTALTHRAMGCGLGTGGGGENFHHE